MQDHPQNRMRLRRGKAVSPVPADIRQLHRERLAAAAPELGADSYFCKVSAAVIHGLPLWNADLDRVHYVQGHGGHGQTNGVSHSYRQPQRPQEITIVDGLAITSLACTAADLMRSLPFGPALATADAALRLGAGRRELQALVASGRGCRIATESIRHADRRSESPYESLSRALMLQHGLPLPELQAELFDDDGFVARCDFRWRRQRVVGEFDGEVKLIEFLKPGETREDALAARQRRDRRLKALGWRVVHWTAKDVHEESPLLRKLRAALGDVHVDYGLRPEALGFKRPRRARRRD